ncbi:ABC transporter permease [Pseudomonas brassicacearum]|uniref:carbohydrate ABC transporter permease n=1 Tax=Pseudomonas brassicacearum TaxID=930166 RepID=UPI000F461BFF|nr:carbohydrate ABC transporter permease [Pseudomonas brassicacearum]ROM61769.1 ABC transporter permease [Pseudomonas brassicacearum]
MRRYFLEGLGKAGFALALLALVLWSLGPVYWAVITSFTDPREMLSGQLHLWPQHPTLEHFAKLFGASSSSQGNEVQSVWPQFSRAFINSLVTSVAATLLTLVAAAFGGYAFVRLRFPGRDLLFALVVASMAVPAYTVMIPLYRLMISLQLIDTYLGVTLIYVSAFLPLALWLMRSVYQSLPVSLEEAAWLDGAGRTYTLVRIVLPLAAPGLIATAILTFLSAWGQFMVPLVFSPSLATKSLTVLIPEFVTRNYVDYGLMNAAGVIAMLPPVLLVIFLNRFLVRGLIAGATK